MATVTFDTMAFVDTLTAAGVPEAQAKAMAKAQSKVIDETHDEKKDYATKYDIIEIKKEMSEMKAEIFKAMLVQTFAIAGLVAGIMAVVLKLFFPH